MVKVVQDKDKQRSIHVLFPMPLSRHFQLAFYHLYHWTRWSDETSRNMNQVIWVRPVKEVLHGDNSWLRWAPKLTGFHYGIKISYETPRNISFVRLKSVPKFSHVNVTSGSVYHSDTKFLIVFLNDKINLLVICCNEHEINSVLINALKTRQRVILMIHGKQFKVEIW